MLKVAALLAGLFIVPAQAQQIRPDIDGLLCTRMADTVFVLMMWCTSPPRRPPDYEQMTVDVRSAARKVCIAGGHSDWPPEVQMGAGGFYVRCLMPPLPPPASGAVRAFKQRSVVEQAATLWVYDGHCGELPPRSLARQAWTEMLSRKISGKSLAPAGTPETCRRPTVVHRPTTARSRRAWTGALSKLRTRPLAVLPKRSATTRSA